jgi:hypothetical protein
MPNATVKSLATKAGVSADKAEAAWQAAKEAAHTQYPELSEDDDKFWAIVTGITKKMIGLKESTSPPLIKKATESFHELCDAELSKLPVVKNGSKD